jgi:hypothetical protein
MITVSVQQKGHKEGRCVVTPTLVGKNLFVILDSCIVSLFYGGNHPVNLRHDNPDVAAAAPPPPKPLGSNSVEFPDYYDSMRRLVIIDMSGA